MEKILKPKSFIILITVPLFLIGAFFHFAFKLSNYNIWIAMIAPVNESIWEHIKMVVFPIICFWNFYYFFFRKRYKIEKNKWFTAGLISLITSIIAIPFFYYFYTEAFGIESVFIDILILFLALFIGELLALHIYERGKGINSTLANSIMIFILIIFILCTFFPPKIPLFKDGPTESYGLTKSF